MALHISELKIAFDGGKVFSTCEANLSLLLHLYTIHVTTKYTLVVHLYLRDAVWLVHAIVLCCWPGRR